MPKRKQDGSDAESDNDSIVNVDFDFLNPDPAVDYQALKRLLGQLFQGDSELFDLNDFAELILAQELGTTVKIDGEESDPCAFLSVVDMHLHKENSSIKALSSYLFQKASNQQAFMNTLESVFSQSESHLGFVFCERLINMPVQVIPHMYRMLNEEMQSEPSNMSHLIFVSRTYHLSPEDESFLTQAKQPSSKKSKKAKVPPSTHEQRPENGLYSFHPEDSCIQDFALHTINYPFSHSTTEPGAKDSFGLDTRGRIMLMPFERFGVMVERMMEVYANAPPT